MVVVGTQVLKLLLLAHVALANTQCNLSADYPACHAVPVSSQRVRRELRTLSESQWSAVVDAMWIMKTVDMQEGQSIYGKAYRSYDYFTVMHGVISTDSRGDQSHYGAHFATVHAAFCLEFENALLAVDPTIEGLPYWDNARLEPSVFTDEYFGVDPPRDGDRQVTTGRFANWTINDSFKLSAWAEYIVDNSTVTFRGSPAQQLRGNNNQLATPSVTRIGSGAAWIALNLSQETWWRCAVGTEDQIWEDWLWCMDGPGPGHGLVHSVAHQSIGGQSGNFIGDFADIATSPNDPLFMFHHANMVRSKMWWMIVHHAKRCSYYGFPLHDGASTWMENKEHMPWQPTLQLPPRTSYYGTNLNDVPGSTWGYTSESLGLTHPMAPAGRQLTNADIICWLLRYDTAPYTYDTQAACLADDECHPKQLTEPIDLVDSSVDSRIGIWLLVAAACLVMQSAA